MCLFDYPSPIKWEQLKSDGSITKVYYGFQIQGMLKLRFILYWPCAFWEEKVCLLSIVIPNTFSLCTWWDDIARGFNKSLVFVRIKEHEKSYVTTLEAIRVQLLLQCSFVIIFCIQVLICIICIYCNGNVASPGCATYYFVWFKIFYQQEFQMIAQCTHEIIQDTIIQIIIFSSLS